MKPLEKADHLKAYKEGQTIPIVNTKATANIDARTKIRMEKELNKK